MTQKCGAVAVLGLPNAGKSTLINALVGEKVSITSRKAQTTRMQIKGIAISGDTQIVLIDTPGIFQAKRNFDRGMVEAAWAGLDNADACILIVDVGIGDCLNVQRPVLERLKSARVPKWLVLNKIDKIKKDRLLELTATINEACEFDQTFMVSAINGYGCDDIKSFLEKSMPEQPWIYDEDQVTDLSQKVMAAEITREFVYDMLHDELPYAIHVETETWEQFDNGSIKIGQLIYVQRDMQKAIVLGRGGAQIKKLGENARKQMAIIFECPVHLNLLVKVKENWTSDPELARFSM